VCVCPCARLRSNSLQLAPTRSNSNSNSNSNSDGNNRYRWLARRVHHPPSRPSISFFLPFFFSLFLSFSLFFFLFLSFLLLRMRIYESRATRSQTGSRNSALIPLCEGIFICVSALSLSSSSRSETKPLRDIPEAVISVRGDCLYPFKICLGP
jgi:hypothetical protein